MSSKKQPRKTAKSNPVPRSPRPASHNPSISVQRQAHPADIHRRAETHPETLTPDDVLQLQRAFGNRATSRLLAHVAKGRTVRQEKNKTGLPDELKDGVEALSGLSMDDVKVHYNSPKPAEVQALAYTKGTDIHVAPGQEQHLPHEAWHVVQQKQGRVKPTLQAKGMAINDEEGLEQEANVMGARALITEGTRRQPEVNTVRPTGAAKTAVAQRTVWKYTVKDIGGGEWSVLVATQGGAKAKLPPNPQNGEVFNDQDGARYESEAKYNEEIKGKADDKEKGDSKGKQSKPQLAQQSSAPAASTEKEAPAAPSAAGASADAGWSAPKKSKGQQKLETHQGYDTKDLAEQIDGYLEGQPGAISNTFNQYINGLSAQGGNVMGKIIAKYWDKGKTTWSVAVSIVGLKEWEIHVHCNTDGRTAGGDNAIHYKRKTEKYLKGVSIKLTSKQEANLIPPPDKRLPAPPKKK